MGGLRTVATGVSLPKWHSSQDGQAARAEPPSPRDRGERVPSRGRVACGGSEQGVRRGVFVGRVVPDGSVLCFCDRVRWGECLFSACKQCDVLEQS